MAARFQEFKRTVSDKQWGTRIDQYLLVSGIGLSRNLVQRLIKDGTVKINGRVVKPAYRVKEGDEVAVRLEVETSREIQAEDIPLDIIHEDDDIVVVNKPKGIVVHPSRGHPQHTMVNALIHHCGHLPSLADETRPGVLHRLDKDTTGLIIFAKTDQALSILGKALEQRRIDKRYLVLCWGFPGQYEGTIEAPIGRSSLDRMKMTVTALSSRLATTKYQVLERFGIASYLKVGLVTGRTHQIRVHMKHLGCPVIGDKDYGGRTPEVIKRSEDLVHFRAIMELIDRQALHAAEISFNHPRTGVPVRFEAPIPEDMRQVLDCLRHVAPRTRASR